HQRRLARLHPAAPQVPLRRRDQITRLVASSRPVGADRWPVAGMPAGRNGNGEGMAVTERLVQAPIDDVYAVLANGWTYSDWVVGTAHIRAVDEHWPSPGAAIHHKAGPWPMSIQDKTVSLSSE